MIDRCAGSIKDHTRSRITTVMICCVVHLPGGVLSNVAVLAFETSMALSYPARCLFPGPPPAVASSASLGERLSPPRKNESENGWPDVDWGLINAPDTATIKALGVGFEFEHLSIEQAAVLDRELNTWTARLYGWLSALTGGPTGYVFELGIVSWPTDIEHKLKSATYAEGKMYEPKRASEWEWRHALAHATNDDPPLATRALLATAITSAFQEDYRPAVLDAATAAELALTQGIAKRIRDHGADAKLSELLLKNKTLGALTQLAHDFYIELPGDVNKNLVEKRNRVTHQGYLPTRDDATEAIRVAQAIVRDLHPFPIHCDEMTDHLEP